MIIAKTPYRISFFGGGTDYPTWSRKHGGEVISSTIDKFCYISCRYLPPFFPDHNYRFVYSKIESVKKIKDFKHPAAKAVLLEHNIKGLEIHHDGDLPARSGIGSSSSFTVGLLNAVSSLQGKKLTKKKLAKEAIRIEQKIIKENVGSQDQIAAAYGGLNHIKFHKDGNFEVIPITISHDRQKDLESSILIVFTGISRQATKIAKGVINNLSQHTDEMLSISSFVKEGLNILTSKKYPLSDFGLLLNESWKFKKKLHSSVSNSSIDLIYKKAIEGGAIGGKVMGAGGGGFIMIYADKKNHPIIKKILKPLVIVPITFEKNGSQTIFLESNVI